MDDDIDHPSVPPSVPPSVAPSSPAKRHATPPSVSAPALSSVLFKHERASSESDKEAQLSGPASSDDLPTFHESAVPRTVLHKKKKLQDLHLCIYSSICQHGGVASLGELISDISPVFPGLRTAKGNHYTVECKDALSQLLALSKLFIKVAPAAWRVNGAEADFSANQLTVEAIQAAQQRVLRRLDVVSPDSSARQKSVPSSSSTSSPDDIYSLVAYSILTRGGSASVTDIVKDVEPAYTGTSSTGRKVRSSCLPAVESVLETPAFRGRFGMWSLAPQTVVPADGSKLHPLKRQRSAPEQRPLQQKQAAAVKVSKTEDDAMVTADGHMPDDDAKPLAAMARSAPMVAVGLPESEVDIEPHAEPHSCSSLGYVVPATLPGPNTPLHVLFTNEEEMESERRFKHYKAACCSVRTVKALQDAIAGRLKRPPSHITSMSHVKETSRAFVHLEEDWQVVALKEDEPKIAITLMLPSA